MLIKCMWIKVFVHNYIGAGILFPNAAENS